MASVTSETRPPAVPRTSRGWPWGSPSPRTNRRTGFRIGATLGLLLIGLQTAGCTFFSGQIDKQYYFIEPSLVSLGEGRIPCEAKQTTDRTSTNMTTLQASDTLVLIYTDCVKKMLRTRMNLARVARLSSGTFAVLTAATAAALGAVTTAPLTAITALAAASAVTPEVMKIFGADDRARAYHDGVRLIERAEGQYLKALSRQPGVSPGLTEFPKVLTPAGAKLYLQVVTSLKIVEDLLVSQLPSVEDIQLAEGRVGHIGEVQTTLSGSTNKIEVTVADNDEPKRTVVYTATVKNVTEAAVGPAVLGIRVRGAKTWNPPTATDPACTRHGKNELRCEIPSLAAGADVKVDISAVAPDATKNPQHFTFSARVWEKASKLPLSGPETSVAVDVDATE